MSLKETFKSKYKNKNRLVIPTATALNFPTHCLWKLQKNMKPRKRFHVPQGRLDGDEHTPKGRWEGPPATFSALPTGPALQDTCQQENRAVTLQLNRCHSSFQNPLLAQLNPTLYLNTSMHTHAHTLINTTFILLEIKASKKHLGKKRVKWFGGRGVGCLASLWKM